MTKNNQLFAERYKILPEIPEDWDLGRGGEALPALDTLNNDRQVVIKRVIPRSKDILTLRRNLEKEAKVLKRLEGRLTPKLINDGIGNCNGDDCYYIAMELARGLRVEKSIITLSLIERISILCDLMNLLFFIHSDLRISNGDVDMKHLYWYREKQYLTVIDWGNARTNANEIDISLDYARLAEITVGLLGNGSHLPSVVDGLELDSSGIPQIIRVEDKQFSVPEIIHEMVIWGLPRNNRGGKLTWSPRALKNALGNWRTTITKGLNPLLYNYGLRWVKS